MKQLNVIPFLCSCFFALNLSANSLNPTSEAPLVDHLIEVNALWEDYDLRYNIEHCISFKNDVDRIQMHLLMVYKMFNKEEVSISENLKKIRLNHLEVLRNYAIKKEFPINTGHSKRQPYFVDNFGTACAVGHLLLEDGQDKFVSKIKIDDNFAYLLEMKYPKLSNWAIENGFSVEELALIQPGYNPVGRDFTEVGNNEGVDGKINKLLTSIDGELMYMCGAFDSVDGQTGYGNIAAWNGTAWLKLDDGMNGEILDMDLDPSGKLYVVGNFFKPNSPNLQKIAMWDGDSWTYRQAGEVDGNIYSIKVMSEGNIFVGGDFTTLNNQPIAYLARSTDLMQGWGNSDGHLTVNGPIYDIENISGNILFAGDFSMTYPAGADPTINQLTVSNLAYWDYWNWIGGFDTSVGVLTSVDYLQGKLIAGGHVFDESYCSIYEAGLWTHWTENNMWFDSLTENSSTTGFIEGAIEYNDKIYIYGGFKFAPFVGHSGHGLVEMYNGYPDGSALFNADVRAAAIFQEALYFAGDFTNINQGWTDYEFNNIVRTTMSPNTNTEEIIPQEKIVDVYYVQSTIKIEYEKLNVNSVFSIFDISGKLVKQINLPQGSHQHTIDVDVLPKGAYAYYIHGDEVQQADMIAIY